MTEKPSTAPSFEDDPIRETEINALACTLVNRYTFMQATAVDEYPDAQTVWLRIGVQSFRLDGFQESDGDAQWMMNMLSKALARLVIEQRDAALAARPSVDVDWKQRCGVAEGVMNSLLDGWKSLAAIVGYEGTDTDELYEIVAERLSAASLPLGLRESAAEVVRSYDISMKASPSDSVDVDRDFLAAIDRLRAALLAARTVAPSGEFAWLIENVRVEHTYWDGRSVESPFYTADPNEAIRFSRKVDAEMIVHWLLSKEPVVSREHGWVTP